MNQVPTEKSTNFSKTIKVTGQWFDNHPETRVQCGGCETSMKVIVSILTVVNCPHCGALNEFEFEITD